MNIEFETVFDMLPVGILTLDENIRISSINKKALQLINKKQGEVIGDYFGNSFNCASSYKDKFDCGHESMCCDCVIKKAINNAFNYEQTSESIEINKQLLIDGKEVDFWFEVSVTPIISGDIKSAVVTLLDITEKRKEVLSLIQSRDFYSNLFNQIPVTILKISANLKCEYVNKELERFTHIKIEEVLRNGLTKVVHPEDLDLFNKVINEANDKREGFKIEARLLRNDGEFRHCLVSGTPYYDLSGQFDGYIVTNIDITDNKKALESLKRYRQLAEITDDIILFIDMDGKIVDANKAAVKAYGYTYEELCSINIRDIRANWGYTEKQMEAANKTGIFFDAMHRRKDGSCFDVEVSSRGTDIDNRRILASIVRDVTERKLAYKKLREQEELFRTVFEQSPIGMAFCESNGRIIDVNPTYKRIFGRSKDELKRLGWHNITHPEDLYKDVEKFNNYKTGELKRYSTIKRYIKPDGSVVWGSLTLAPLEFGNIKMNLSMIEDITERLQAEHTRKKSESRHKAMIANISDVITIIDGQGNAMYISPNISKVFGWEIADIISTSVWERVHPDDIEHIQQEFAVLLAKENSERTIEFRYRCKDGGYKIVELTAKNLIKNSDIHGILLNYRDITDRKEKENEIKFLNHHDVLTGLFNRRFFEKKKIQLDNNSHLPLSVIIGDINGLKQINEALGYTHGDKFIIAVSKVIQNCIRKQDILARTGGDDFSIIMPNTSNEEANIIMKQIELAFNEYKNKAIYNTSISFGCFTKTNSNDDFNEILKHANDNMYQQKLLKNESSHSSVISSMKINLFEKSQETEQHAQRLIILSKAIGQKLKLSDKQLNELELISTLHDIGKIGVKDNILNKDGMLTPEEWAVMKNHPDIGYRIAMSIPELQHIAKCILSHHERYDGKGYPKRLKGQEIPLLSRIIAVVDSYDAMTEDRIYRKAISKEAAINEIQQNAGTQFDPEIAKVFIDILSEN